MRQIVGSLGVVFAVAALVGCSPSQAGKTNTPNDISAAMQKELSHTVGELLTIDDDCLLGDEPACTKNDDAYASVDAKFSQVGTTTITSATMPARASSSLLSIPMPLPESRLPLAPQHDSAPSVQTWGGHEEIDLSEIPDTRE